MRHVGLHVRLNGSVEDLVARMREIGLSTFQCFLVEQSSGKLVKFSEHDRAIIHAYIQENTVATFAHSSYLVNPARDVPLSAHYAFKRELVLAKQLGFSHVVLHPGSFDKTKNRKDGIELLARFVNTVMRNEPLLRLVLENIAFANHSLGGDLEDFRTLLEKIDKPDKLAFCIDTAHAHAYGYDVITQSGQQEFVRLLDATIGLHRIVLIHLNDTQEARGSRIDKHAVMGEGVIGHVALQAFALHPELRHIPLLMELPVLDWHAERAILEVVRNWH